MARIDGINRAISSYQRDIQWLQFIPFTDGLVKKYELKIKELQDEANRIYAARIRVEDDRFVDDSRAYYYKDRWHV